MYIMMSIKIYPAAIAGLASLALIAVAFLLSPLAHAALTPTVGCIEFGDTGADVYRVGAVFETVSKSSRSQINYMGNDVCLDANRLREYYCYTYTCSYTNAYSNSRPDSYPHAGTYSYCRQSSSGSIGGRRCARYVS